MGEPLPASGAAPGGSVREQLATASARLDAKDLPGALAIYEAVLAAAGERPDVLVSVSGELGARGFVGEIVELVAPLYDAERHGPATGLNLLQAYLALQDTDAAQHMLDVLFALKRPDLEQRLYGFSNALAELLTEPGGSALAVAPERGPAAIPPGAPKGSLVTIAKPMWSYGLESLGDDLLPPKQGKLRRIAFAQLAVLGLPDYDAAMQQPDAPLDRLARGIPLWFAETFYFSPHYAPFAGVGVVTAEQQPPRPMIFGAEWTTENLRQLVGSSTEAADYVVTGSLRPIGDEDELVLRIYEVKGYRERKKLAVRWTPATVDAELAKIHSELCRYMEWKSGDTPIAYNAPKSPSAWIDTLATSLGTFLVEKGVLQSDRLPADPQLYAAAASAAASGTTASLAFLTLAQRARGLGVEIDTSAPVSDAPVVAQAKAALGLA